MKRLSYIVLLAIAGPALAVQHPADAPPGRADFDAMRRKESDDLALVLGLSASQRPALDAFLAGSAPPRPPQHPMAGAEMPPESFEQQLARREQHAVDMSDGERKHIAAVRNFYGVLNARQRQLFEAVMRLRHGPGGADHGPDGGRPGPRGPNGGLDGPPPPRE